MDLVTSFSRKKTQNSWKFWKINDFWLFSDFFRFQNHCGVHKNHKTPKNRLNLAKKRRFFYRLILKKLFTDRTQLIFMRIICMVDFSKLLSRWDKIAGFMVENCLFRAIWIHFGSIWAILGQFSVRSFDSGPFLQNPPVHPAHLSQQNHKQPSTHNPASPKQASSRPDNFS